MSEFHGPKCQEMRFPAFQKFSRGACPRNPPGKDGSSGPTTVYFFQNSSYLKTYIQPWMSKKNLTIFHWLSPQNAGHDILRYWQTRTHCCGHIVADTNVSPFTRARNICCGYKFCVRDTKMFLILFRNILCPQQMFPSLRAQGNVMSNNVSATMCPRLPVALEAHILNFFPGQHVPGIP